MTIRCFGSSSFCYRSYLLLVISGLEVMAHNTNNLYCSNSTHLLIAVFKVVACEVVVTSVYFGLFLVDNHYKSTLNGIALDTFNAMKKKNEFIHTRRVS